MIILLVQNNDSFEVTTESITVSLAGKKYHIEPDRAESITVSLAGQKVSL